MKKKKKTLKVYKKNLTPSDFPIEKLPDGKYYIIIEDDPKKHTLMFNEINLQDVTEFWIKDNNLHREDGPALFERNGGYCWLKNGLEHRIDGPAQVGYHKERREKFTSEAWYQNGERHREDGPASYTYKTKTKEYVDENWYQYGKLHRLDGPALIWFNSGSEDWAINGVYKSDVVEEWIKENNFPKWQEWTDEIKVLFKLRFG